MKKRMNKLLKDTEAEEKKNKLQFHHVLTTASILASMQNTRQRLTLEIDWAGKLNFTKILS